MTSRETKSGRILAIDYGRRRIGLALSDDLHLTARPLATLLRKNRRDDLLRLREIVREHHIIRIVVGRPLHLDGEESEMGAEASAFARRVAKALGVPVELYDERLTSWEANQIPAENPSTHRPKGRHGNSPTRRGQSSSRSAHTMKDHLAAAILLRDYLQSGRATRSAKA